MKRLWLLSFLLLAALICLSCSSDEPENPRPTPEQPENPGGDDNPDPTDPTPGENGRYLVVFASRSGNTERVAQIIRTTLNCDLLEVEPSEPYEEDYNAMLQRAQTELDGIARGISPPYGRRSRIFRSTILCSSASRYGITASPRRCRRSCTVTPTNLPASG